MEEVDTLEAMLDQIQESYFHMEGARDLDKKLLNKLYSKAQGMLNTLILKRFNLAIFFVIPFFFKVIPALSIEPKFG